MITKIGVKNFKVFKDEVTIQIKPITILTGANNSGKSTFLKLFQFIHKVFKLKYDKKFHGGEGGFVVEDFETLILDKNIIYRIGNFKNHLNETNNGGALVLCFSYLDRAGCSAFEKGGNELTVKLHYVDTVNANKLNQESKYLDLDKIEFYFENTLLFFLEQKTNKEVYGESSSLKLWSFGKIDAKKKNTSLRNYFVSRVEKLKSSKNDYSDWQKEFNPNHKIVFESYFFRKVMTSSDFFKESYAVDSYENGLKNFLNKNNINSHDDLIIKYIEFETVFINVLINIMLSDLYEIIEKTELEEESIVPKRLKDIFSLTELNKRTKNLDNGVIEKLLKTIKNPISEIILTELLFDEEDQSKAANSYFRYYNMFIDSEHKVNYGSIQKFIKLTKIALMEVFNRFQMGLTDQLSDTVFSEVGYLTQKESIQSTFYIDSQKEESVLFRLGIDYFEKNISKELKFINKWLETLGIADELYISKISDEENNIIGFSYMIKQGSKLSKIDNMGLGSKKILLILIQLSLGRSPYITSNKENIHGFYNMILHGNLVLLEEPESNLHPSFQSKLADIIVDAQSVLGVRVLVETHSEYLIRKLQYLVASKENDITKDDIAIYYMYNPNQIPEGENQIYQLDLRDDGFMNNDFGSGFFDEASSLSLRLLNFSNFN